MKFFSFFGLYLNFAHTLFIFPVLVFRLNLHVSDNYKFILLTLLFNMGDVIGKNFFKTI